MTGKDNKQERKPVKGQVRLARYLAACGLGSRRACEQLIEQGKIRVNGQDVKTPALNVDTTSDTVLYEGRAVKPQAASYYMLNKPAGYTCSANDPHARRLVFELLPQEERLFSVGRLDRDSEGLLILTNDGTFSHRMAHPKFEVPKTYKVKVSRPASPEDLRQMTRGLKDKGEFLKADKAYFTNRGNRRDLTIVISEGKKREIRRLCYRLGFKVERLVRVRFGKLSLSGLAPGKYRRLSDSEVKELLALSK